MDQIETFEINTKLKKINFNETLFIKSKND